jgi:hypothetical protein
MDAATVTPIQQITPHTTSAVGPIALSEAALDRGCQRLIQAARALRGRFSQA